MSAADDAAGAAERKKEDDERLERAAFLKIVRAMQNYASDAAEEVHRWETNFERLSPAHQALLSHHREKHVEAYRCVQQNDAFLSGMLAAFSGDDVPPHLRVPPPGPGPPTPSPRATSRRFGTCSRTSAATGPRRLPKSARSRTAPSSPSCRRGSRSHTPVRDATRLA